jgi:hypothetical protein
VGIEGSGRPGGRARSLSGVRTDHPDRSALLGLFQFTVGGVVAPLVGVIRTTSAVPMVMAVVACLLLALSLHTAGLRVPSARRAR